MLRVVEALQAVRFDGVMIADHIPLMAGTPKVGSAYSICMMKAWVRRPRRWASRRDTRL